MNCNSWWVPGWNWSRIWAAEDSWVQLLGRLCRASSVCLGQRWFILSSGVSLPQWASCRRMSGYSQMCSANHCCPTDSSGPRVCFSCLSHAVFQRFYHQFFIYWNFKALHWSLKVALWIYFKQCLLSYFKIRLKLCWFICRRRPGWPLSHFYLCPKLLVQILLGMTIYSIGVGGCGFEGEASV